jgi:hypothetical protein
MTDSGDLDPNAPWGSPDPNPYASPGAATLQATLDAEWSIGESLEFGWRAVKSAPWVVMALAVAVILAAIPDMIGGGVQQVLSMSGDKAMIAVGLGVRSLTLMIGIALNAWFVLGKSKLKLAVCRGSSPPFATIFERNGYWSSLGATLMLNAVGVVAMAFIAGPALALYFLWKREDAAIVAGVAGGLVFFVAALIVYSRIQFFPFLIVEQRLGPIDSIRESWRMTTGHTGGLVVYAIVTFLLFVPAVVLGTLACLIGLVVTLPATAGVCAIAQTFIYLRLRGEQPRLVGAS